MFLTVFHSIVVFTIIIELQIVKMWRLEAVIIIIQYNVNFSYRNLVIVCLIYVVSFTLINNLIKLI